jgi:hypothetical protein
MGMNSKKTPLTFGIVVELTLSMTIIFTSLLFATTSIIRGGDNNTNNALTIDDTTAVIVQPAYAQPQHQEFTAKMTGSQEVPPKSTSAAGTVTFEPTPGEMTLSYKVTVNNIDKVTMAHIHKGKAGENGPVVVTLFTSPSPTGKLNGNTTLVQGNLRADNLEGLLAGKHIPDLIIMIKDNDAYVNVHTAQNPKGEIRGQILSVSSSSATAAPQ